MKLRSLLLVFYLFSVSSAGICANIENVNEKSIDEAQLQKIAQSDEWLALLHYRPQGFLFESNFSEVDDDKFFISTQGKHDPLSELVATIDAFTVNIDGDGSAQCRFPARFELLSSIFPTKSFYRSHCPEFDTWSNAIRGSELYLIFPASYINSPSSMFGHTLFRLDGKQGHKLLSSAINFAAVTDSDDDEITYSIKGLTGGYPGYVSLVPYYEKVNTYSHIESRDIWEYKLDVTQDQIDQFIRHIWELNEIRFDYYFIDENCSYRLLTILDAVIPGWSLSHQFKWRTVPSDTIRVLIEKEFITDVQFRPSKTTLIESNRQQLSSNLQDVSRALADDPFNYANDKHFMQLAEIEKAKVLELAYDYTRYLATKKKVRDPNLPKRSLKLLSLRSKVSYKGSPFLPPSVPSVRDEQGHNTLRGLFSVGDGYLDMGFRINYHDWLDQVPGYREGAQIEMGQVQLRAQDDLRLQQFDVLHIRSLGPRSQFSHPFSWQVRAGYQRWITDDEGQSELRLGAGVSYRVGPGLAYSMAITELSLADRYSDDWRIGYGPEVGYLIQSNQWNFQLSADRLASFGTKGSSQEVQLGVGYALGLNHQVRFQSTLQGWRSDQEHDLSISYAFFY